MTISDVDVHVVANHGVDKALVKQVFDENRKFFSLPEEEKMCIIADENNRWNLLSRVNSATTDALHASPIHTWFLPASHCISMMMQTVCYMRLRMNANVSLYIRHMMSILFQWQRVHANV